MRITEMTGRERELLRMVADAVMTQVEIQAATRGLRGVSEQLVQENQALHAELAEVAHVGAPPSPPTDRPLRQPSTISVDATCCCR